MFPAQSLAEAMLAKGWRVRLSTDARGARYAGGFPDAVERRVVRSSTFARGGILGKILAPFQIGAGCLSAVLMMARDRPQMVVGFGGYPAIPAMVAAWVLRVPRMIHEQNGVLGRVNQLFATRVNKVLCAVWPTELPAAADAIHTGNPVRSAVREVAGSAYVPPNDAALNLLVFGGSQGASILSRVVPKAIALLDEPLRARLQISQQAREADLAQVTEAYHSLGVQADIRPFFDDIPQRLVAAQLVIARSGASSVADIAAIGRPAIFVPLAIAIRDEQTANARALEAAGGAQVLQEPEFTPENLAAELADILTNPSRASDMAKAAQSQGMPDAVDNLAAWVEDISGVQQ